MILKVKLYFVESTGDVSPVFVGISGCPPVFVDKLSSNSTFGSTVAHSNANSLGTVFKQELSSLGLYSILSSHPFKFLLGYIC